MLSIPLYFHQNNVVKASNETIPFPYHRYVAFDLLNESKQAIANSSLEYVNTTWNMPGTASIEDLDYFSISDAQKRAVLSLGFVGEDDWDCYINHYDYYDWDELLDDGVQIFYLMLGWTEKSWEGKESSPPSEEKDWDELASCEQIAADELCFFEEIWDRLLPVYLWNWTTANASSWESNFTATNFTAINATIVTNAFLDSTKAPTLAPSLRGSTNFTSSPTTYTSMPSIAPTYVNVTANTTMNMTGVFCV